MDGTGPNDNQQPIILAINNGFGSLATPGNRDRSIGGERKILHKDLGRDKGPYTRNVLVVELIECVNVFWSLSHLGTFASEQKLAGMKKKEKFWVDEASLRNVALLP